MQGNQTPKNSKATAIALVAIIVISFGLFFYYFQKDASDDPDSLLETTNSDESNEARAASDRIVKILNQVSALQIDDKIFKTAVYKSLVDYSVQIPEQNVGRVNPFAPVSGIVTSAPAVVTPTVVTPAVAPAQAKKK